MAHFAGDHPSCDARPCRAATAAGAVDEAVELPEELQATSAYVEVSLPPSIRIVRGCLRWNMMAHVILLLCSTRTPHLQRLPAAISPVAPEGFEGARGAAARSDEGLAVARD